MAAAINRPKSRGTRSMSSECPFLSKIVFEVATIVTNLLNSVRVTPAKWTPFLCIRDDESISTQRRRHASHQGCIMASRIPYSPRRLMKHLIPRPTRDHLRKAIFAVSPAITLKVDRQAWPQIDMAAITQHARSGSLSVVSGPSVILRHQPHEPRPRGCPSA